MVRMYFIAGENYGVAARLYRERWPDRRHPHRDTIAAACRRFMEHGNVLLRNADNGRPQNVLHPALQEQIEDTFENDPTTSVREVARATGVSKTTVHKVIADTGKHPYHYRKVQQLLPNDYQRRVQFCGGFLAQVRRDAEFLRRVLWTDECTFTRSGMINQHNCHYWALDNPHLTRETNFQYRWSINVWAGIVDGQIVSEID